VGAHEAGKTLIPAPAPAAPASDNLDAAERIWRETIPIAGTPGESYLSGRGITIADIPGYGELRFLECCPWHGGFKPCVVGRCTDALTAEPRGIWRRPIDGGKPMSLGPTRNCVLRLWPDTMIGEFLTIGEGVETVLYAANHVAFRGARLFPAWAAGNTANLASFPIIPRVNYLIVLVDNDEGRAGEIACEQCEDRWLAAGRDVKRLMPEGVGTDFNDWARA
jgi:putative DNA primase/helicase